MPRYTEITYALQSGYPYLKLKDRSGFMQTHCSFFYFDFILHLFQVRTDFIISLLSCSMELVPSERVSPQNRSPLSVKAALVFGHRW